MYSLFRTYYDPCIYFDRRSMGAVEIERADAGWDGRTRRLARSKLSGTNNPGGHRKILLFPVQPTTRRAQDRLYNIYPRSVDPRRCMDDKEITGGLGSFSRGTGRLNPSRETKFSGTHGDRRIFISPVQLTTSRIGNLTRLIHTLLYVMTIHAYIHTVQLASSTIH